MHPRAGLLPRRGTPSLHEALLRGLPFGQALGTLQWHHTRRTLAMAAAQAVPDLLDVPGDDVDAARIADWSAWQSARPATDDAVAAAYQDFVGAVHPWVSAVGPGSTTGRGW